MLYLSAFTKPPHRVVWIRVIKESPLVKCSFTRNEIPMIRTAVRFIAGLCKFVILSAIASAILSYTLYYFLGKTSITTEFEGKSIVSEVWVNGEHVGDTPFEGHLGAWGNFDISIIPPAEYQELPARSMVVLFKGATINDTLTMKVSYQVLMTKPSEGEFEVLRGEDVIAVCSGTACAIPLPGPGEYRARMQSCAPDGSCVTGGTTFTLSDTSRVHHIAWKD